MEEYEIKRPNEKPESTLRPYVKPDVKTYGSISDLIREEDSDEVVEIRSEGKITKGWRSFLSWI